MTYITGWKNKTSVFIVADSVITSEGDVNSIELLNNVSTFNETHIKEDRKIIQEKSLKIYNIDNKLIIAFAGTALSAYRVINDLTILLEATKWNNIRDCLSEICEHILYNEVNFIFGFIENENPILISFDSTKKIGDRFEEHRDFTPIHFGSISEEFICYTNDIYIEVLKEAKHNDEQILVILCGLIQSYQYKGDLMSDGIGGFISGIRIDSLGIHWQKDVVYIPFKHNGNNLKSLELSDIFDDAKMITIISRDSFVFVKSPFLNRKNKIIFSNYQPTAKFKDTEWLNKVLSWINKWTNELDKIIDEYAVDYFIFINIQRPIIITIVSKEFASKIFRFDKVNNELVFTEKNVYDFIKTLTKPQDEDFTINFLGFTYNRDSNVNFFLKDFKKIKYFLFDRFVF